MKSNKKFVLPIGCLIVILTTAINIIPYLYINKDQFWLISFILLSPITYDFLIILSISSLGTIISAIVGNKRTGLLTFVFTGVFYIIKNKPVNVLIALTCVVACIFICESEKINKIVSVIISTLIISAVTVGLAVYSGDVLNSETLKVSLVTVGLVLTVLVLATLIEKLPVFKMFDEETRDLDHNYRVHSIKRKLMLIINVICIVLVLIFSVISIIILSQKEQDRKASEESIWNLVVQSAISEDADIYANHDTEAIQAEAAKIAEAFGYTSVELPVQVIVITNISGEYYSQVYEITHANGMASYGSYKGEWVKEKHLSQEDLKLLHFLPDDSNSYLYVYESSRLQRSLKDAIGRYLSVALVLIIFMNVLVEAYIRKIVVKPINRMTTEAMEFAFGRSSENADGKSENSGRVEINSGDEIESLNKAFHKTMDDVEAYVDNVREKSKQVADMQHNIIVTMADIIESRDMNTGGHIKRTAMYVGIIARKLVEEGHFTDILTDSYIEDMIVAAPLHDMGKIHVPDHILNKNGKLSDEEYMIMKTHASAGKDLLDMASDSLGEFKYLVIAKEMAESHHEWWNGNGYPDKLAEDNIPLSARIMAVADVFDALVSKRCYKEPMDLDVAFGIIEKETGTHFDPVVGKAFLDSRQLVEETLTSLYNGRD